MKIRITAPSGNSIRHIPTGLLYSEVITDERKRSQYVLAYGHDDPTVEYLDGMTLNDRMSAMESALTITATEMVAPQNLVTDDIVYVNGELFKATCNISHGSALTEGTNCVRLTFAEWVASLTA